MKHLYRFLIMLKPLLVVLAIAGILQISGQWENVAGYAQSAALMTGVLNAGDEADDEEGEPFNFDFKAYSPNGQPLDVSTLKNKVVFLNIWATWCGPCRAEMPSIEELYRQNKNPNIAFVILSRDQGPGALKKVNDYLVKFPYTMPIYIHPEPPTGQLSTPVIPTTLIISKSGKIVRTESGMRKYNTDRFKKFLEKLAAE